MVESELLLKEESTRLVLVSSGWAGWLRSIRDQVFLLDLVLPVYLASLQGFLHFPF